ncbi:MAG: hypothetical protein ABIA67_04715, partial [Candidatus Margulisiibacteriota bacterium]
MPDLNEPLEFLKAIHQAGVKYLLIGRQAIIAYGGPVQTMDYDIYVSSTEDNLALLLKVAKKFDLVPSLSKEEIRKHFKFRLENDMVIDIFKAKYFSIGSGKKLSFDELYARKVVAKGETGLEINLPSVDD